MGRNTAVSSGSGTLSRPCGHQNGRKRLGYGTGHDLRAVGIIIASFVTVVELVMQAFAYPLFLKLGIFIPLIVVNCIVLGRAEAFASKNNVSLSTLDGLGIGIGFTLGLSALGAVRELLGTGALTIFETPIQVFGPSFQPFTFMIEAPGAFVGLGLMLCIMNLLGKK
jgi:electron transport complex protein RnfE